MKKNNKSLHTLLLIFLIFAIGLFLFFSLRDWYNQAIFNDISSNSITIDVLEGDTFLDVLNDLNNEGYIASIIPIQVYLRTNGLNPNIKVGSYEIPASVNIPKLIEILEKGTFKPAIWVTVKEGLQYEQIASALENKLDSLTQFSTKEFFELVENPSLIELSPSVKAFVEANLPKDKSLRGFLYPDTYRIDQDMTTSQIIEMFLSNFKEKIENNISSKTDNRGNINSLYQALILASIIEKEASASDNRAEISGVFHNRLESGIGLESDATVNFITGKNDPGISLSDQKIDSPYNTYLYRGLPPTPINNPRIDSIVAALKPNETKYFFFYHTPDGKTFFNESVEEHINGVCRDLGC